jgi:N-methylhydantoinase B
LGNPARGRHGGKPGSPGEFGLIGQEPFRGKSVQTIPPGERLYAKLPGGGGFGDPHGRNAVEVADEVRAGLVSVGSAREAYAVVVDESGKLDHAATDKLRQGFSA